MITRKREPSRVRSSNGWIVLIGGGVALGLLLEMSRFITFSVLISSSTTIHLRSKTIDEPHSIENRPEVAWLMTYPNSGTTYTLKLIQQYTNTTTATNYGNEHSVHNKSIPVHPELANGPFLRFTDWKLPSRYILTKTHCGGTALSSDPLVYLETMRSFEVACRSGNRIDDDENKVDTTYSMDVPKRVVHLIRSPFDNIVARLHLEEKRWRRMDDKAEKLQLFNATRDGFRAWCQDQDRRGYKMNQQSRHMDDELWNLAKVVPCHDELIRYTLWHNHAIELIRQKNLPGHTLLYEDYEHNWDRTVNELFEFVSLSPAPGAKPYPFIPGKHYKDYYDPSERVSAMVLVKTIASPETWNLVKHYFHE